MSFATCLINFTRAYTRIRQMFFNLLAYVTILLPIGWRKHATKLNQKQNGGRQVVFGQSWADSE